MLHGFKPNMKRSITSSIVALFMIISHNTIYSNIVVHGITLPEPRTRDLIICNDESEFYLNEATLPLPWTNTSRAISNDLLFGLSANQLILCTKSLWRNVQFLGEMWQDFATLSPEDLANKYQPLSKMTAQTFAQKVAQYGPSIKEIHRLYNILNDVIASNHSQPLSVISDKMNRAMQPFVSNQDKWETNEEIKNNLQRLFTTYTLYQLALANNYICKEITQNFILFIPRALAQQPPLDPLLHTTTNQQEITPADIFLGLQCWQCNDYNFLRHLPHEQAVALGQRIKTQQFSPLLGEALQKLVIKKSLIKKEYQDYLAHILPNFNIYLSGHGSFQGRTAGLSTQITTRSKTYPAKNTKAHKEIVRQHPHEISDFLHVLRIFNDQLFMKSLMISSCYPAGKKLIDEFNITSKLSNPILESLTYPIIMKGSSFSPTLSVTWQTWLPPFQNQNVENYIYPQQKKYGPNKQEGQEAFIGFFNFLNGTTTYEKFLGTAKSKVEKNKNVQQYRIQNPAKKEPTIETFTTSKASLLHAANVFSHMYDDAAIGKINTDYLTNYILIKFPHTEWFTPARFKKLVYKLSPITALAKDRITIAQEIQLVLMEANHISATIVIPSAQIPIFMPINYVNQNYVFDKIEITNTINLDQFIKQFFTIKEIKEPINVVIKHLKIGTEQYSNVYIYIHNNFGGAQGFRNGYAFSNNSTHQTVNIHWPYNQPFDTMIKTTEGFNPQTLQRLLQTVTTNSFAKSVIPSGETIHNLAENIAKQKRSPIPSRVLHSRKEYERKGALLQQKTKSLLSALELASILKQR